MHIHIWVHGVTSSSLCLEFWDCGHLHDSIDNLITNELECDKWLDISVKSYICYMGEIDAQSLLEVDSMESFSSIDDE